MQELENLVPLYNDEYAVAALHSPPNRDLIMTWSISNAERKAVCEFQERQLRVEKAGSSMKTLVSISVDKTRAEEDA
jgi:hypothetical protein